MMETAPKKPVVLCFSGLDPTGGAGIQADIEAISAQGAHATSIVTALTVQDTHNVKSFQTISADIVIQQARAVLEDMPVSVIKLGMLGNIEIAEAIHSILKDYPDLPVIFDPVLAGGGGGKLAQQSLVDAIKILIMPLCYIITPNTLEARQLAKESDNNEAAAMELLDMGAEYVLLTGSHEKTRDIQHQLFSNNRLIEAFNYARLDNEFHGSGCTLAAAIAGLIAQGNEPVSAIHTALDYTYKTLQQAQHLGMGQLIPNRYYWIK
ncbi:MAG: hydroxymethylpyrimidine/phosphomethylpyrimidine kinase [Gammaproteobacteria bacterium]|nr:hydroxymethylpyrimidine/phosphomethylpyrimidine kinase [Gammaproteobacteria bacterium]MCW8910174.1 hydroxymethylpyrimidine/phosphomethylpyrimidine kinase [Gammaproteobacteria bacterium]MCW9006070.1 hydroxymethylpyrimidine/phosphomethylpyrimidine kinase [Gammaproteobacteria bacterium]MCW9056292.1 hydroxymethylpyrimidine/phosphomethylpyrimidine kinase [Gammaproteobacteria bacterium]